MSTGITSILWFIAVIAMIPAALWLLKRTPMGGGAAQGLMRSVAMLPLSPSQRIVTVEVGQGADRQWLVLGVTANSITTLHTMAPQADVPPAPMAVVPPFAQLLGKLRRDQGASGER
ncbi:MAG TPA: flagellar biosynthetic protein FliO [Burkholderiaceae bacterium]|nr:flagellar biosynthetic protein FliO [Burkholderiaceae bacterium]